MKVLSAGICSVALISLVGCSAMGLNNKNIDYGAAATQVPTLEIPPDLTAPETDDRYKVADGAAVATYSAYSKEAAAPVARSAVLPEVKGVSLEHNGTQRWLLVADKAENVWPVVKAFLHDTGLNILSEDQAAGVIQTDWTENRAKIPQGGLRSIIGKVFDGLYSSNQRDQYRVRLERSKDGAGTEIYITQYGKEEIMLADGHTSQWQSRPSDPELEAEMLQRLMVRFGGTPVQAAAAVTPGVAVAAGSANLLQVVDGSSVIVINDAFDKSWRRVGLAIERSGYVVEDKDREKGVYFLRTVKVEKGWMDKLQFWKDEQDGSLRYRVNVKDGGASCEVSVTDQNGANSDASKQRLDAIYKNINQ
ncbi:MAG: outer membrane protein assembly factor BamC [Proteobacteria bacterium]|nr:outer membrane protein assembly factor BamC [Pseudomonadota bacterium]